MAKKKTAFFCQNCGTQSPKWLGKCPSCNEWNTFVEEVLVSEKSEGWKSEESGHSAKKKPRLIKEIEAGKETRVKTHDHELNRVLGGGIVLGSLVLIGGEPGIGKSTLLLQVSLKLPGLKILYVSGEESEQQIKLRAQRIGDTTNDLFILTETNLDAIFTAIKSLQPQLLVVDSIQTIFTEKIEAASGSISQVRQCAGELMKFAK
jgi:DNA repair protein RadA/Sms